MKVFLVEDSPLVRERLVEIIQGGGTHHVVGEAATYQEAIEGIAATNPDVGIFDIKLACGSGIDALVEVRRRRPQFVGIVITNYSTAQFRKASADAGAAFFLDKSSDFERIAQILAVLSERDRAEGAP